MTQTWGRTLNGRRISGCSHSVHGKPSNLLCTECYNALQREIDARKTRFNLGFVYICDRCTTEPFITRDGFLYHWGYTSDGLRVSAMPPPCPGYVNPAVKPPLEEKVKTARPEGWMKRQFDEARVEVARWPKWMQEAEMQAATGNVSDAETQATREIENGFVRATPEGHYHRCCACNQDVLIVGTHTKTCTIATGTDHDIQCAGRLKDTGTAAEKLVPQKRLHSYEGKLDHNKDDRCLKCGISYGDVTDLACPGQSEAKMGLFVEPAYRCNHCCDKVFQTRVELLQHWDLQRETVPLDTFETKAGYKRVPLDNVRFDLIPAIALRRLSAIYAEGAVKYGDTNWQNGSLEKSTGDILNHAYNHLTLYQTGDRSEDHLAKVMWSMAALLYFEEKEEKARNEKV